MTWAETMIDMADYKLTPKRKAEIDAMSRHEMCRVWRFAATGNWLIMGECGQYFKKRLFDELGGFTPQISKSLGD